ncbi:DUF1656 domain-containing protein [Agarivorans litoreus]|uniref:DUF1656 domain-containing protein n=1 Tax=Agarivorans litoreus TaxID=1510455 RepID=UPI001C7DFB93|nr:DUF1656 domain-containing protein [Agarivorans litoreus]
MFEGFVPKELVIGEIYFPPLLVATGFGYLAASLSMSGIMRMGWHRHLYAPTIVELSLLLIYTVLISTYIFPG